MLLAKYEASHQPQVDTQARVSRYLTCWWSLPTVSDLTPNCLHIPAPTRGSVNTRQPLLQSPVCQSLNGCHIVSVTLQLDLQGPKVCLY